MSQRNYCQDKVEFAVIEKGPFNLRHQRPHAPADYLPHKLKGPFSVFSVRFDSTPSLLSSVRGGKVPLQLGGDIIMLHLDTGNRGLRPAVQFRHPGF
jgi:hypothetical protein